MTPPAQPLRAVGADTACPSVPEAPASLDGLVGQLMARTAELERTSAALERAVGAAPCDEHDDGTGLAGAVAELTRTIGHAPNDATGDEGSGLMRVVAELARGAEFRSRSHAKAGAVGAAGALVIIEGLLELGRHLGLM